MMADQKESQDDTKQTVLSIAKLLVSALLAHQTLVFDTISRSCLNNAIIRPLKAMDHLLLIIFRYTTRFVIETFAKQL